MKDASNVVILTRDMKQIDFKLGPHETKIICTITFLVYSSLKILDAHIIHL